MIRPVHSRLTALGVLVGTAFLLPSAVSSSALAQPATGEQAPDAVQAPGAVQTPGAVQAPGAVQTPGAPSAVQQPAQSATAPSVVAPAAPSKQSFSELLKEIGVEGGLTSAEVGRRAAASSYDAEVQRQEVLNAAADSRRTYHSLFPRLTATARYTRFSRVPETTLGSPDAQSVVTTDGPGVLGPGATLIGVDSDFSFPIPVNYYHLNLGVTIPLSDYLLSTTQAMRGSKALREGAELQESAIRLDAAAQAKLAYYEWVRSKLQVVVAKQSLQQATAQLERTKLYFSAGRIAEADVMQAQAFVSESQLLVTRAETAVTVTEQRLRTGMHAEPDEVLFVGEDVMQPFGRSDESASLNQMYAEAVRQRLEIRSLDRTQYSFSQASEVKDTDRYPRVEAFGNLTYANPNQRIFPMEEEWNGTWDVGVQAVWTINDLWIADAERQKLDNQRAQLIAQRRSLEDALRLEILTAHGALREAKIAVQTAEQGHQAAEAALAARELLHSGGRATSFELIQAETARLQARLNLVEAHIALRVARVQLDHALGRDVAELKQ